MKPIYCVIALVLWIPIGLALLRSNDPQSKDQAPVVVMPEDDITSQTARVILTESEEPLGLLEE